MGFSVRVLPGVRVRVSSRGVRTSVGPRAARVHVGGGRTGFSTGVGPFTYYTSGGARSRSRSSNYPPSGSRSGSASRGAVSIAQTEKLAAARGVQDKRNHFGTLHEQEFPKVARPIAPAPPPLAESAIRRSHKSAALQGISVFAWAARKQAKLVAAQGAEAEIAHRHQEAELQRQAYQVELDQWWSLLCANDPATLMGEMAAYFEDNEAPAAPLGVEGDEVSVAVLLPSEEQMPDQWVGSTAAGNLSLRMASKTENRLLHTAAVAGTALVTVKEIFAVAPSVTRVIIVGFRVAQRESGEYYPECLLGAAFPRDRVENFPWPGSQVGDAFNGTMARGLMRQSKHKALLPLDLTNEPALRAAMDSIDLRDFSGTT